MKRLAIIAAFVVLGVTGAIVAYAESSHRGDAYTRARSIRSAVDLYRAKTGDYPSELNSLIVGWEIPFLHEIPLDPWKNEYVFLRPVCVLSRGPDGRMGTPDDISVGCEPALVNQHVLLEAGLKGELDRNDVYGRKIQLIQQGKIVLAWSYGQDGRPDTEDDQMARISAAALARRN